MGSSLERNRRFTRCALRMSSIPGLSFLPFPHQWFPIPSGFSVRLVKYLKGFRQWADVVKVVSTGTSRSRTSVAWRDSVVGVCRGERWRKWSEVPDGKAFVGVDWGLVVFRFCK